MDEAGRLRIEDWLAAGFRALLRHGHSGLRAEALARDLGVSADMFREHFADAAAFRAEILADWAARAYGGVMAGIEAEADAAARLQRLALALVHPLGAAEDAAMRIWAREDAVAAQAVAELDARRFHAVKALCLAAGVNDPDLPLLIYAASAGYAGLAPPEGADAGMRALLRMAGIS